MYTKETILSIDYEQTLSKRIKLSQMYVGITKRHAWQPI